jgi:hypothetical protein
MLLSYTAPSSSSRLSLGQGIKNPEVSSYSHPLQTSENLIFGGPLWLLSSIETAIACLLLCIKCGFFLTSEMLAFVQPL